MPPDYCWGNIWVQCWILTPYPQFMLISAFNRVSTHPQVGSMSLLGIKKMVLISLLPLQDNLPSRPVTPVSHLLEWYRFLCWRNLRKIKSGSLLGEVTDIRACWGLLITVPGTVLLHPHNLVASQSSGSLSHCSESLIQLNLFSLEHTSFYEAVLCFFLSFSVVKFLFMFNDDSV